MITRNTCESDGGPREVTLQGSRRVLMIRQDPAVVDRESRPDATVALMTNCSLILCKEKTRAVSTGGTITLFDRNVGREDAEGNCRQTCRCPTTLGPRRSCT